MVMRIMMNLSQILYLIHILGRQISLKYFFCVQVPISSGFVVNLLEVVIIIFFIKSIQATCILFNNLVNSDCDDF